MSEEANETIVIDDNDGSDSGLRERKPNFCQEELNFIFDELLKYKGIMLDINPVKHPDDKRLVWETIAAGLVQRGWPLRTSESIKRRWYDMLMRTRNLLKSLKEEGIRTQDTPKWMENNQRVVDILSQSNKHSSKIAQDIVLFATEIGNVPNTPLSNASTTGPPFLVPVSHCAQPPKPVLMGFSGVTRTGEVIAQPKILAVESQNVPSTMLRGQQPVFQSTSSGQSMHNGIFSSLANTTARSSAGSGQTIQNPPHAPNGSKRQIIELSDDEGTHETSELTSIFRNRNGEKPRDLPEFLQYKARLLKREHDEKLVLLKIKQEAAKIKRDYMKAKLEKVTQQRNL